MRTSTRTVTNLLRRLGIQAELVRGEGYHYFAGEDVPQATFSVMQPWTSEQTPGEWVRDLLEHLRDYPAYEPEAERYHALAKAAYAALDATK